MAAVTTTPLFVPRAEHVAADDTAPWTDLLIERAPPMQHEKGMGQRFVLGDEQAKLIVLKRTSDWESRKCCAMSCAKNGS